MKYSTLYILAFFALTHSKKREEHGDLSELGSNITFARLPTDIKSDFYKILTGAANALGGSCLGVEPDYNKVELLLYSTPANYTRLNPENPMGIVNDAPLYILSHGWVSGLNGYKIKAFRNKYIELYGKNVVFVNWGKLAWYPYNSAACNIPFIGKHLAKFLCTLSEKQNYDLSKVHITGHSLGGQLAGLAGKGTQKICNKKIGKITALDPAGPLFQLQKAERRLTPNDAEFVEVVHSNSGVFGYVGKAGTVDYHLNCGSIQPGCIIPKDFSKIAETSMFMLCCSHMRSIEIWPYVLESGQFKSRSCKLCSKLMPASCIVDAIANYISLGHTYSKPKNEHYNLITSAYKPFQLGCKAYPFQGCN